MNIVDAKRHVKDTVEAYFAKDEAGVYRVDPSRQRPLFLVGAPGIGKTAIMAQIARELEIGLVSYSMTHHTRQSALGLPFIVHKNFDGIDCEVSEYTMSEIVASVYDYMERTGTRRGILFLDEINCVSETLYPSMLQFLQFKTFGRHRIPSDWIVVCAGNPPEYNRSVHEFDIVTLDRLRKLEVEPDYAAWREYALETNVHPSILSFLEVKKECFYSVESTPSGKSFVTARGWDDLSEIISLFEAEGKPVDRSLIGQFIQDVDIAERFSVYYELFNKYRSDYRVERILAGEVAESVVERAQAAPFDERLALLGLLLDGLASRLKSVLEQERSLGAVRDLLRSVKDDLLAGASVADVLDGRIADADRDVERERASVLMSPERVRCAQKSVTLMRTLRFECDLAGTLEGPAAFDTVHHAYRGMVGQLEQAVKDGGSLLEHAFDFVERVFGNGREMLVFVTELTARKSTVGFINRFGCERYYASNSQLMVDDRRKDLLSRIDDLGLGIETKDEEKAAGGVGAGGVGAGGAREVAGAAGADGVAGGARAGAVPDAGQMKAYYDARRFEFGFASLCHMSLPEGLSGKSVLDVGCRRGKGVFKLSDRVGEHGRVLGVDWVPDYIAEAKTRMDRAWRDSGLPRNNMEFAVAYPEDLLAAGAGDSTFDMAFMNSSLNLTYDIGQVLRELFRVLKPGAFVTLETVVASTTRDEAVVQAARDLGNSIQAAPSRMAFEALVREAGFEAPVYEQEHQVEPTLGFKESHRVATAPSNETVNFTALVATLVKPAR